MLRGKDNTNDRFFYDENKFDYNVEYDEFVGLSPKMKALFLEDAKNRASKVAPDTTGADKFFIDSLFTEEMELDFWMIAKDFMQHHFPRLKEFNDLAIYGNDKPERTCPERALQDKIMNIIYNAAKSGDVYAVELVKYLHKTYHKKEYKQLKRFSRITVPEILLLAEIEDFECDYFVIARIMGMCVFYGIELDERCSLLYLLLGKEHKEWEKGIEQGFFKFPEGLFKECYDQVEEWLGKNDNTTVQGLKRGTNYRKAERFAEFCLKRQGYPKDYVYRCNKEYLGIPRLLAQTLALLKSAYPNEDFSFEEVQTYSMIANCIDAIVSICVSYDEGLSEMLDVNPDLYANRECRFNPEKVTFKDVSITKAEPKPVNIAPVVNKDVQEEDYLKEIEELRRRLREKEEECKHFRRQYEQMKLSLVDAKEVITQNERYVEELIALRHYVYSLSQEAPPVTEDKLENMKHVIAEKKVVIIGGHVNWVKKLRNEFPNWLYVDANISGLNDSKLLEDANMVYFFTAHISHSTYGKYVKFVRENQVPFGYIHSVNMENLIRQVFEDIKSF